jgi:ubiquinone/menaquinone biosynthesis C-methylase UbiE
MNASRIRSIYDARARRYDRTVGLAENLMLGDFRQRFGALMTGRTLEIGVGSGLNLPHYTPAVAACVGLDLSAGMLAVAQERAASLGLPIRLVQGDAERLPFADSAFDTVGVSLALCTVPDPARALREMSRVCRPDGRIVLLEHVLSPHLPVAALERLLTPLQVRTIGCHLDRETIETARREGLRVESEEARRLGVFRLAVARPIQGQTRGAE